MNKKQYALIRIDLGSKKLFDAIALKYNKKTNGLFQEMCHFYNENYLNQENKTKKEPLNLQQAFLSLRKGALGFLNTLEQIDFLVETSTFSKTIKQNSNENKERIKKILAEFLNLVKKHETSKESSSTLDQKKIQTLENLINKI